MLLDEIEQFSIFRDLLPSKIFFLIVRYYIMTHKCYSLHSFVIHRVFKVLIVRLNENLKGHSHEKSLRDYPIKLLFWFSRYAKYGNSFLNF
jgi:hypothetical protein